MSPALHLTLQWQDWLSLFIHFLTLSLLAIGGAITTAPDMHRYLVTERSWLTDPQFSASIALAQAAPGPNVLFIALLGWNVGMNAGGVAHALLGVLAAMAGILLPSTTLAYVGARWAHANRGLRAVRAFKQGFAPIVIALLISTGWLLARGDGNPNTEWPVWATAVVAAFIIWRYRKVHILLLLAAGALLGWFGLL
jgi:chromate transporter